jgi:hypothetical protein
VAPGNCLVVEDSVIGLQVDHISIVHVMIGHFVTLVLVLLDLTRWLPSKCYVAVVSASLTHYSRTWLGNEPVITSSTITWGVY